MAPHTVLKTVVSGTALLGAQTIPAGRTFTLVIDPDTALVFITLVAPVVMALRLILLLRRLIMRLSRWGYHGSRALPVAQTRLPYASLPSLVLPTKALCVKRLWMVTTATSLGFCVRII